MSLNLIDTSKMNEEKRNYKLSVIWKSQNPEHKFIFMDGSEQYFYPRLKLEKIGIGRYELVKTLSDIYRPVEDYMVDFAYDNSLELLARSISYTYHYERLKSVEEGGKEISDKALLDLKDKVKQLKSKKVFHLNQIKENYGKNNKRAKVKQVVRKV